LSLQPIICLNGKFVPESEARVSVFDHGFLYGDGIFESLTATRRRVFRLDQHVARLFRSAAFIRLAIPLGPDEVKAAVLETLRRNDRSEAYIRIVVSRGPGYPLLDPRVSPVPTFVVFIHDPTLPPSQTICTPHPEGLKVIISSTRKTPSVCIDARVKSLNYLNQILAREEAVAAGADEAVQLDVHNFLAEAPAANVFLARGDRLYTPFPNNVLEGITRSVVIELAATHGIPTVEANLTAYDLYIADEAFFSSSFGGVLSIREVNGRTIGRERPGPISRQLQAAYADLVERTGTPY
jgi:branched-chain amino acid aminotransferase